MDLTAEPVFAADLHCHLLPGIDDGARDLDDAVAMALQAADDGIASSGFGAKTVTRGPTAGVRIRVARACASGARLPR